MNNSVNQDTSSYSLYVSIWNSVQCKEKSKLVVYLNFVIKLNFAFAKNTLYRNSIFFVDDQNGTANTKAKNFLESLYMSSNDIEKIELLKSTKIGTKFIAMTFRNKYLTEIINKIQENASKTISEKEILNSNCEYSMNMIMWRSPSKNIEQQFVEVVDLHFTINNADHKIVFDGGISFRDDRTGKANKKAQTFFRALAMNPKYCTLKFFNDNFFRVINDFFSKRITQYNCKYLLKNINKNECRELIHKIAVNQSFETFKRNSEMTYEEYFIVFAFFTMIFLALIIVIVGFRMKISKNSVITEHEMNTSENSV